MWEEERERERESAAAKTRGQMLEEEEGWEEDAANQLEAGPNHCLCLYQ